MYTFRFSLLRLLELSVEVARRKDNLVALVKQNTLIPSYRLQSSKGNELKQMCKFSLMKKETNQKYIFAKKLFLKMDNIISKWSEFTFIEMSYSKLLPSRYSFRFFCLTAIKQYRRRCHQTLPICALMICFYFLLPVRPSCVGFVCIATVSIRTGFSLVGTQTFHGAHL